jgi:catechol 2,3-dioxygenase-like lactoylglutathione lyase family enzyme
MPIEYLQIVSVPVSNQDQAKEFYVNGLGWDLLSDEGYQLPGGEHLRWLEVRPHGGQTAITLTLADDAMRAGSMKGMTLRATDLESTVADLAGRCVVITEVQETPWAKYVNFEDPDGNSWIIQEPKSPGGRVTSPA